DRDGLTAGWCHRRLPGAPRHEGRGRLRDVDAVVALAIDGECRMGRVELDGSAGFDRAQVERDVPRCDLDLDEVLFLVDEAELGVAPGPDEGAAADLQLEIAAISGIKLVARRQGRVDLRGRPVLSPRTKIRNFAVGIAEPGRGPSDRAILALGRDRG